MGDELITFVIDGSPERGGAIPVRAFLDKFRVFLATMYGLDCAYSRRDKTQIEFEIVNLTRRSPARLAMRARAKENGYDASASTAWGFKQLIELREGRPIDNNVSEGTLDNIINLARWREAKLPELGTIQVVYGDKSVTIDETLGAQAMLARSSKVAEKERPWTAGVSHGSVFGELLGVMDLDGAHKFYVVPPSGPKQVQCTFPENLREKVREYLFKTVRVRGLLHYDGDTPFPSRIDADGLEGVGEPARRFSQMRGIFRDMEPDDAAAEFG